MTISSLERIPEFWSDETDAPFFAIVARLFSPTFTYAAGVLLAENAELDDADSGKPSATGSTAELHEFDDRRTVRTSPAARSGGARA
jgi:hypothetical protein